uniref:Uncharacterized protein n=1 Tax=Chrysotila carterae TaxID=13221 RepID=A0A7S4B6P9_CHRCT
MFARIPTKRDAHVSIGQQSRAGLAVGAHACALTYAARCTYVDWPTVSREGGQNARAIVGESALQDLPWVRMLARIPSQRDAHVTHRDAHASIGQQSRARVV